MLNRKARDGSQLPIQRLVWPTYTQTAGKRIPYSISFSNAFLLLSVFAGGLFFGVNYAILYLNGTSSNTPTTSSSLIRPYHRQLENFVMKAKKQAVTSTFVVEQNEISQGEPTPRQGNHDGVPVKEELSYLSVNIVDFGAIGDNHTNCTEAIRSAMNVVRANGGGEVLVPKGGVFQTGPFNLTSNMVFRVEGTLFGISDQHSFPVVDALPSYGRDADLRGKYRRHPFVYAVREKNITIRGHGTIDGGGWYWYPFFFDHQAANYVGRPHLVELNTCTNIEIFDVTLKDSAFWTLHPVYCHDVHIHHTTILAPSCRNYQCANTDGMDIDSCENVLVEHNHIDVGDDHVTILAGKVRGEKSPPTRNVTVQHNTLLSGMGMSIGSSTAGGVSDVLYYNNTMTEKIRHQFGQGLHIKVRDAFGGYVRNVAWIDNVFHVAGKPGGAIKIEAGYQTNPGWKSCGATTCAEIRDIVVRNLVVEVANPGSIKCYPQRPCVNITFDNVHFQDPKARVSCKNVASGSLVNNYPPELFDACLPNMTKVDKAVWKEDMGAETALAKI